MNRIQQFVSLIALLLLSPLSEAGITYGNAVNTATSSLASSTSNTTYLQDNILTLTPAAVSSILGVSTHSVTTFMGSGVGGFTATGHAIGSLSEININMPGVTTSTSFPLIGVEGIVKLIDGTPGKAVAVLGSLNTLTAAKTISNYYGVMSHANSPTTGVITNAEAHSVDWSAFAGTITNNFIEYRATNPGGTISGIVYGLYCDDLTAGAASGCVGSVVNSGSLRYGLYFTGTAQNALVGNTYIGASTDGGGGEKLQVTGTTATSTLKVNSSVSANSGGIKHGRITTGSIAGASTALVTVTWGTAFADANYSCQAQVLDSTTSSLSLSVVHIESVAAATITVRVINNAVGALTGTLHVMCMHD